MDKIHKYCTVSKHSNYMVPDFVFIVALNTNPGNKMLPDFIHVHVSLFYTYITFREMRIGHQIRTS